MSTMSKSSHNQCSSPILYHIRHFQSNHDPPCKYQFTHRNPFVLLGFLCGSSGPPIPLPFLLPTLLALPSPAAISLSAAIVPLRFSPPPLPLSILNPFQPSSSRS